MNEVPWALQVVILVGLYTCASTPTPEPQVEPPPNAPRDLQAWLDAAPELAHPRAIPGPLELPPGEYLVDDTDGDGVALRVNKPIYLRAHGAVIRGPEGVIAFEVGPDAAFSIIEGLTVVGPRRHDESESVGIRVRAGRTVLRDVRVSDFNLGVEYDGTGEYNTNLSGADSLHVWRCRVGMRLDGADANAGLFTRSAFTANLRAIEDSSFLGNTWIAPSVHPYPRNANAPAILVDSDNSASVWVGAYLEGQRAGMTVDSPQAFVLGGNAVQQVEGRTERAGSRRAWMVFNRMRANEPGSAEVRLGTSAEIPLRWDGMDPEGGRYRWMIRRFGQRHCITPGSGAQCAINWPDNARNLASEHVGD